MKHAANIITVSRIALAAALPALYHRPGLFAGAYLLCGLTDALDGFVARRTKTQSALGARLDSLADAVMFLVIAALIFLYAGALLRLFLVPVLVIFGLRVLSAAIAAAKYRALVFLHTVANKAAGLLIFLFPLFPVLFPRAAPAAAAVVCAAAFLSAAEECAIHLTSKHYDLDRRSLFPLRR